MQRFTDPKEANEHIVKCVREMFPKSAFCQTQQDDEADQFMVLGNSLGLSGVLQNGDKRFFETDYYAATENGEDITVANSTFCAWNSAERPAHYKNAETGRHLTITAQYHLKGLLYKLATTNGPMAEAMQRRTILSRIIFFTTAPWMSVQSFEADANRIEMVIGFGEDISEFKDALADVIGEPDAMHEYRIVYNIQ